ncbi:glycosyltransferase [Lacihabitans soyangensis]|uniref:Glycosyltransferase n=1 Tax=Lacihabitans soyangensis TaxID=869394 RepID=A0AAE3KTZ1_9BACT|nr:glycosyltransferase [Lacihabitans soyangensis]MCP9764543.1 glycosyltransferase [Lacihabitans soyangensis]
MHFVHILSYTWENGGASKVVYDLAKFQVENGDKATVITMDMPGHKRYKDIEGVQFISVQPHLLTRFFPLFSVELWKILKENKQGFDVIHLHGLWNFTLLAAHLLGLHQKSIVTVHGCAHPYTFMGNRLKRALFTFSFQKNFLKKVKMIHVLHHGELNEVEDYMGAKSLNIRIIPNGIDIPEIPNNRPDEGKRVLFLSRLHQKKGLDLLLPAFKKVLLQVPDAELIIAGPDFGMLDFVQDFILKNKLENSIKYIGTVNGQAKTDLLLSSKVFALPSYSEGFSIAVLEALVYQIPVVVSTETGLSNEIKESEAGIVIEFNDDSISYAIIDLLKNAEKAKEIAQNGRKLVLERFETNKVCSLFDQEVKKLF